MKFFKFSELIIISLVFGLVVFASYFNIKIALRRARDFQRKEDIGNLADAIVKYQEESGFYPPSSPDGKIVACKKEGVVDNPFLSPAERFRACDWFFDSLYFDKEGNHLEFLTQVFGDPLTAEGHSYRYFSTGKHFQIYASLEGHDEDEFNPSIESRNLICGTQVCNFGRSSKLTPLDKSLEEYENEIRLKEEEERLKARRRK